MPVDPPATYRCGHTTCVNRRVTRQCGVCKSAWYCSSRCQNLAWDLHVFDCVPCKEFTPTQYLSKAVADNVIPTDSPTRELFCFSRAAELHGEQFVLDLYKRLFSIDRSLTARDVQRWAKEHTLVENIKDKFRLYGPVGWKGIPYAWFLHYEYIFQ